MNVSFRVKILGSSKVCYFRAKISLLFWRRTKTVDHGTCKWNRSSIIEQIGGIDAFISDRQVLTRWDIHDYSGRVNFTAQNQNISHVTCLSLIWIKIRHLEFKNRQQPKSFSTDLVFETRFFFIHDMLYTVRSKLSISRIGTICPIVGATFLFRTESCYECFMYAKLLQRQRHYCQ